MLEIVATAIICIPCMVCGVANTKNLGRWMQARMSMVKVN